MKKIINIVLIFFLIIIISCGKIYAYEIRENNITINKGPLNSFINVRWPSDGITITDENGKNHQITTEELTGLTLTITDSTKSEVKEKSKHTNLDLISCSNKFMEEGNKVQLTYDYSVRMDTYTQSAQYGTTTKVYDYAQGSIIINFEVAEVGSDKIVIDNLTVDKGDVSTESMADSGLGTHVNEEEGKEDEGDNTNDGKVNRTETAGTADEIMQAADDWLKTGETDYKNDSSVNDTLFRSTIEQAYNILLAIGFVVIIAVGAVLAIQFMLASADQKAVIKQKMLPYLTGCCVIFGAFGIWLMVIRLLGDPSGVSDYGKIDELGTVEDADMIKNLGNNIIGIIQAVGSFVAIIMLIVLGIKYMTGSVEEKAEYKVTMKNYFIGAILLFGITNFIAIVQSIAVGIFG